MERLARLAHRIVWVNPRVSADAFSVQSGGMVAALPYCDALVSGHSFEALGEVVEAIGAESWARAASRATPEAPDEPEPWASATPVAGQLGRDAERARPEPGQCDAGLGDRMTESAAIKICIYPGCERPAVPPHRWAGRSRRSATWRSTTR